VSDQDRRYEEGGDAACWAHLVCPECGRLSAGPQRGASEAGEAGDGERAGEICGSCGAIIGR